MAKYNKVIVTFSSTSMKITQLRNATVIIEYKQETLLVDPMLAPQGKAPALKYLGAKRRKNPLVELPDNSEELLAKVTHCLITHCQKGHFDHLDRAAVRWLRQRQIPVLAANADEAFLQKRGLHVMPLSSKMSNAFAGGLIELVPCVHGHGIVGKLMAHGVGYYIEMPGEPSVYITGDTLLTETIIDFVQARQPDVIIAPAGGARFDFGGEIIMGAEDVLELASIAYGQVIANHLEALDHCPVSRLQLGEAALDADLGERVLIPDDGQTLAF
ncbi:MBL fold metallo-hydrolase [Pseudoalteromonas sp. BDTF-M6]|uniref:MBL fold metallo-hydrolase n=1 Tax=Pseudoalteromonas sp. BDTF-M6 TaxID=2796132 RepID=UPI001BAECD62|nr:MBL fold metallo-hydrolase [Pseudoalteromonas sp. BDTF-M6]MBS3797851.1 MBL fold metallo-hydrolase [Pseudoalteromonas sp. BDTF-M6]